MAASDFRKKAEQGAVLLSLLATFGFLVVLVWSSYYGLDLSDESAQLNWIAHPWLYKASVTQYGYIFHPFFNLLGNDIALIRQFNFLVLYVACFVAAYALLQLSPWLERRWELLATSVILSTGVFWFFQTFWITVPGYNSLTLVALCVIAAAFVLVYSNPDRVQGWLLFAVGGWLALMAKPTTAVVSLVIALIFLTASRSWSLRGVLTGSVAIFFLVLGSALYIDGSIITFAHRLMEGAEWATTLGGGHTWINSLRLDDFTLNSQQKIIFWVLLVVGFSSVLVDSARNGLGAWANILLVFVIAIGTLLCFVFWDELYFSRHRRFQVIPLTGFPVGMILATLLTAWRERVGVRVRGLPLVLAIIVLPYAYVFGTNNNYWKVGPSAGIFWVLAGAAFYLVVFKRPSSLRPILLLAVIVQLSAVVFVNGAMKAPYRQPQPIWLNEKVVPVGVPPTEVVMEQAMGEYIVELKQIAREAGFEKDTPMIDMSGHYPGSLYALGARPLGSAWLIGGYPGSLQLAYLGLSSHACGEIASAWTLDEPEGPRRLDPSLLEMFGMSLEKDFVAIGRLNSPPGQFPKAYEHVLYQPLTSEQERVLACEEAMRTQAGDKPDNTRSSK